MRDDRVGNVVPFSRERAGTRRTILIAWPPSGERAALEQAIEGRGHRVRTVDDGRTALSLLERDTWYAVVLHTELPDGGGLWVAKTLACARLIGAIADNPLILVASTTNLAEGELSSGGISRCLIGTPDAEQVLAAISLARASPRSSAG